MIIEEYGIVTFESTHHAINGEKILKDNGVVFKTIPTPREITLSCGLSIRFNIEYLDKIMELYTNNHLAIKGIYKYKIDGTQRKTIKII